MPNSLDEKGNRSFWHSVVDISMVVRKAAFFILIPKRKKGGRMMRGDLKREAATSRTGLE